MDKIRYRLVYNRQKKLNKQGTALVQIEAYLNQRKIYLKTNVYLKPECWSREGAQVINHPQSNELNAMLYEYILYLQGIELGYWKRGIPATLSLLKDAVKKKSAVNISFSIFAKSAIDNSDKKQSTKDNLSCEPSYLCYPADPSGSCDYNSPEATRTYFRQDHTDLFRDTFQHYST